MQRVPEDIQTYQPPQEAHEDTRTPGKPPVRYMRQDFHPFRSPAAAHDRARSEDAAEKRGVRRPRYFARRRDERSPHREGGTERVQVFGLQLFLRGLGVVRETRREGTPRHEVLLHDVPQKVHEELAPEAAHEDPPGRQAVRLRAVRQGVRPLRADDESHERALGD